MYSGYQFPPSQAVYTAHVPERNGSLKAREFLFTCEELALAGLDVTGAGLQRRVMWTILQYYACTPWLHLELQPQVSRGLVELGLHFEGSVEANEAAALALVRRPGALLSRLGDAWEFEVWTPTWRRFHRSFRFERLTPALAREVAIEFRALLEAGAELLPQLERVGQPFLSPRDAPLRRRRGTRPRPRR